MKVLMFGWEFPPHISGGLGTACYGLTKSLSGENIDILFVVPKLHGEESAGFTNFIDASDVPIATESDLEQYLTSSKKPEIRHALYKVLQKEGITHIEVSSALSPYRSLQFVQQTQGIEHWNYSLRSGKAPRTKDSKKKTSSSSESSKDTTKNKKNTKDSPKPIAPYRFSGVYGPDLLDEVKRYAQVGASIAKKYSFDVIHAHDWMTYLAGIAAKKVSGKPLVVHIHATEHDRSGENVDQSVYAIEHYGMAGADKVVAVSEWTKKIAVSRYHVPEEKVEVVYNGIHPKAASTKHFSGLPLGSNIVTFLGRITHQKGPMYFVEAARKVLDQIPETHFIMAGSGDLLPLMIERIAQLRMSSHFHFTGFLKGKDIDKVWSMSNVYVMPSVSEPFGISSLEAIQAGVPVILSRQSGVAEIMPHAIRVDFWNSQELAGAICSVLKYRSLSNTLRKNSTEEISTLTWNNAAKKLTRLYNELTTEKSCA